MPVSSIARIIPVTGARTTAVNRAPIPTTEYSVGFVATPGNQRLHTVPKRRPTWEPRTNMGANKPPGVRAAYDTAPSAKRRMKMKTRTMRTTNTKMMMTSTTMRMRMKTTMRMKSQSLSIEDVVLNQHPES